MGPFSLCSFPVLEFSSRWNEETSCKHVHLCRADAAIHSPGTEASPRQCCWTGSKCQENEHELFSFFFLNFIFSNKVPHWNSAYILVKHSDAGWPLCDIFFAYVHQERPILCLTTPRYSTTATGENHKRLLGWVLMPGVSEGSLNQSIETEKWEFIDHLLPHEHNSTLRQLQSPCVYGIREPTSCHQIQAATVQHGWQKEKELTL